MKRSAVCTIRACLARRQLTRTLSGCSARQRATAPFSWLRRGVFAGFAAGWIVQENVIEETPDSNRFGYVSDVCVPPAFRGRGIAARLLEALEARLSLSGVARIRLSTLAANQAARAAYERSGYAPYEIVYEKAARGPDLKP
jgi:ribosomal protein S18 acetylase RimI-like enzyme